MSTRGYVSKQAEDGSITAVYVHHDAYLVGLGQQLLDWCGGVPVERVKFVVDKLMAEKIGWSALCDKDIDREPGWTEPNRATNWDTYYESPEYKQLQSYTARGEEEEGEPPVFANLEAFRKHLAGDVWIEYTYLFNADYTTLHVYSGALYLGKIELSEVKRFDELGKAQDIEAFIKEESDVE